MVIGYFIYRDTNMTFTEFEYFNSILPNLQLIKNPQEARNETLLELEIKKSGYDIKPVKYNKNGTFLRFLRTTKDTRIYCPTGDHRLIANLLDDNKIEYKEIVNFDFRLLLKPDSRPFAWRHFKEMSSVHWMKQNKYKPNLNIYYNHLVSSRQVENKIVHQLVESCRRNKDMSQGWLNSEKKIDDVIEKGRKQYMAAYSVYCINNNLVNFPHGKIRNKFQEARKMLKALTSTPTSAVYYPTKDPTQFIYKSTYTTNMKPIEVMEVKSEMLHEYLVGAHATNKLRFDIPNFAFIYGLLDCGVVPMTGPVEVPEPKAASPRYNSLSDYESDEEEDHQRKRTKKYEYFECVPQRGKSTVSPTLVYEKVDGEVFYKFIQRMATTPEGKSACLEVFYNTVIALSLAYERMKFVHGDLHTGNVMVMTLDKPETVDYVFRDFTITTYSRYRPVIIDYGFAQYEYKGNIIIGDGKFYSHQLTQHVLKDVFKLALYCSLEWNELSELLLGFTDHPRRVVAIAPYAYGIMPNYELYRTIHGLDYLYFLNWKGVKGPAFDIS